MKSTREKILYTLLSCPGSTINELAEAVGINGISIRHHLTNLEADDLVTSIEERHGVGRPRLIYSLTEKGIEKFPSRYFRLSQYLIEALKNKYSSNELVNVFQDIGKTIASSYKMHLNDLSTKERLKLINSILTQEGFVIEWKEEKEHYNLIALSCPYYKIGLSHEEVCALDHTLISEFFSSPIKIKTCILDGDQHCAFLIPKEQNNGK